MPRSNSPLFRTASKALRDQARQEIARTRLGRLVGQAQRELVAGGSRNTWALHQALLRYVKSGPREAVNELRRTPFGLLARSIEQYSRKGPMRRTLEAFLAELGPAGKLLSALSGAGGGVGDELAMMRNMLRLFGMETLAQKMPKPGTADWFREKAAIEERAREMGFRLAPEDEPEHTKPAAGSTRYRPDRGEMGNLAGEPGWLRQYPPDHPIRTGQMVETPNSSNVHSIGYDYESAYLYVRYLGYVRGTRGPDGHPLRGGPGSLYRYSNVTADEFLSLLAVAHGGSRGGGASNGPGEWVWDHLRIRGTWSGHQKDYELVGIMGGYVPRKATVEYDPETGRLQEVFRRRRVQTSRGEWLESQMADELAPMLPFGRNVATGRPDTGEPEDRGFDF